MPRLAIAQIRPAKGEYAANVQRIGGVLAQLAKLEPAVDLVVFPETATSGYFVEGGVRDVAVTAGTLFRDLSVQHEAAQAPPLDVAVGFYEGVKVAYSSLVGYEGGKGFQGGSVVVSRAGQIELRGPLFEEAVDTADIGLEELTRARADAPLLADLEVNLQHLLKDLGKREKGKGKGKARSVQFDPASNGAFAQSAIRNPQSAIHVVGRGV